MGEDAAGLPERTVELRWIHLRAEHLGGGVGRTLAAQAVADLQARAFRHAGLWVFAGNERARRFYTAGGWAFDSAARPRTFRVDDEQTTAIELRYARAL